MIALLFTSLSSYYFITDPIHIDIVMEKFFTLILLKFTANTFVWLHSNWAIFHVHAFIHSHKLTHTHQHLTPFMYMHAHKYGAIKSNAKFGVQKFPSLAHE